MLARETYAKSDCTHLFAALEERLDKHHVENDPKEHVHTICVDESKSSHLPHMQEEIRCTSEASKEDTHKD